MLRIVDHPEYSPQELKSRVDLRVLVAPGRPVRGDRPVKIRCLWHDERDPSLVIWADRMRCFGCDTSMDLLDFVAWREGLDVEGRSFDKVLELAAERYVGLAPPPPPAPTRTRQPPRGPMSKDVARYMHERLGVRRAWFHARGLTDETIDRELLGYDRKAFTIPVWSAIGELLTVRYRRDDDVLGEEAAAYSKYWGIPGRNEVMLYNAKALQLVADWGWVVICEGELDALRLYQEGVPALSVTNGAGALDRPLAREIKGANPQKVVVAYDQDERGRIDGIRVARMFGLRGRVMRWSPSLGKDVTDVLRCDPIEHFVAMVMEAETPRRVENYWQKTLRNGVWR